MISGIYLIVNCVNDKLYIGSAMPWVVHDFIPIPLVITASEEYCWKQDQELKKQFAIALVNSSTPFEAACSVFGKDTNKALWAASNWVNDPVITQTKQEYIEVSETKQELLDRAQLSLRLLSFSEEKVIYNGNEVFAAEAKDRLAALKLYAEIQGFMPKNNTEINNNFNPKNNFMEIRFVEPEKKDNVKVIDASPNIANEDILENSPIKLKLVG